jgi:hypothetical protein
MLENRLERAAILCCSTGEAFTKGSSISAGWVNKITTCRRSGPLYRAGAQICYAAIFSGGRVEFNEA